MNDLPHVDSSSPGPCPLDLEQLEQRCLGNLKLVERLLNSFEQRFSGEVAQIEQSLAANDVTSLVRNAHQLKGAAANLSAIALQGVFQRIEEAGRAGRLDEIPGRLGELTHEWDRFRKHRATIGAVAPSQA